MATVTTCGGYSGRYDVETYVWWQYGNGKWSTASHAVQPESSYSTIVPGPGGQAPVGGQPCSF